MDHTLSLLMALAWPVVTLAIALIFRQDVTRALSRVGRLKYHDLEVTFQQDLHEAEELARSLPPPPPASRSKDSIVLELSPAREQPFVRPSSPYETPSRESEALGKLAEQSPRTAIEKAWNRLSQALERGDRRRMPESETRLVELLQDLRAHASRIDLRSPSGVEARRFVDLACALASRIESRV